MIEKSKGEIKMDKLKLIEELMEKYPNVMYIEEVYALERAELKESLLNNIKGKIQETDYISYEVKETCFEKIASADFAGLYRILNIAMFTFTNTRVNELENFLKWYESLQIEKLQDLMT